MAGVNKAILVGNLGGDPEEKVTRNGEPYAVFSLATNETWKDKRTGERKSETEWHRCVLWGNRVSPLMQYAKSGTVLYVEGKIETRKWEDDAGQKHSLTQIRVLNFEFVGGRRDSDVESRDPNEGQAPAQGSAPAGGDYSSPVHNQQPQDGDDDIPF